MIQVDTVQTPRTAGRVVALLGACTWPSEAYWRAFELSILEGRQLKAPVLELGCGDGAFTELAGFSIDEAIDLNHRAVERARARGSVYKQVRLGDVRALAREAPAQFKTVFANSVLEHVNNLGDVLVACERVLRPGGTLVATVPLADMNRNLLLRSRWYVSVRQRQLRHRNLWSLDRWREELARAGFADVDATRYLDPGSCRFWDALDLPAGWGIGRYRLGPGLRRAADVVVSGRARAAGKGWLAGRLGARTGSSKPVTTTGCAALLVATKAAAHDAEVDGQ